MSVLPSWTRWNRPLLALSGIMGVLMVVALFGIFLDDRIVTGAPVWMKVFKFAVSFLLYGLTLAWTLSVLPTRGKAAERAAIVIVAAVDVPWQLWQHLSKLRMTRQEIRDELKETEGSPEIKSRIRSVQQELARRRMMQEIPKADVVVVNPTHYSVALRYDERRMRAPVVVAKGVDAVALRIREIAAEHRVPIFEAPPLARALYRSVDIGAEIPASLYVAVAQVLTYVYQLRAARRTGEVPPVPPKIDPSIDQTRH